MCCRDRQLRTVEDKTRSGLDADEPRQALGAAASRKEPERHLGKTDAKSRVVGRDPPMAGERDLEAAAQRRAVERRDPWLTALLHLAGDSMESFEPFADRRRVREPRRDRLEIAPGHETGLG